MATKSTPTASTKHSTKAPSARTANPSNTTRAANAASARTSAKLSKLAEVTDPELSASGEISTTESIFASELPSPSLLAEYEEIIPGGAARLFELAETRAKQSRDLERKTCETKLAIARFKQISYFILAFVTGIFGGTLLLSGSELAGLMIILIDAAVIASTVIYGKSE